MLFTAFWGCKKKEKVGLPELLITPTELETVAEPSREINFSISIQADAGIARFEIVEIADGMSAQVVFDSVYGGKTKNSDIIYTYKMPDSHIAFETQLSFRVTDQQGEIGTLARILRIVPADTLLPVWKNIVLYSGKSGKSNGYFIETDSVVNSDSVFFDDLDIVATDTSDNLQFSWSSPKENGFVLFSGFNYDSATFKSISEAYEYGTPATQVSNLQIGDIIITKLSSSQVYEYALIKLTNIVDDSGSTNDRYVFDIKK